MRELFEKLAQAKHAHFIDVKRYQFKQIGYSDEKFNELVRLSIDRAKTTRYSFYQIMDAEYFSEREKLNEQMRALNAKNLSDVLIKMSNADKIKVDWKKSFPINTKGPRFTKPKKKRKK